MKNKTRKKTKTKVKTKVKAKVKVKTTKQKVEIDVRPSKKIPIVGIGASAGGLEAFESFFKAMPASSGVAFVVVAHLDPTHATILPELLQKQTMMNVYSIEDGMKVKPNTVYVIPPNKELSILHGSLQLLEQARERGVYLPIDSFFRSLAQDQGDNAICIILSGTGTDGTMGLKAIKGEAGMAMVQDEKSAKYSGMPTSAISTDLADYVLPPQKMPQKLIEYTKRMICGTASGLVDHATQMPEAMQKIFVILRARTGHDFSLYKKNTICRRIERRLNVHQIDDIRDYARYLRESDSEVTILFKELLIGVTNFFRDPKAFEILGKTILPKILKSKPDDYSVRIWVPGCSSGEEAYSIAIVLQECMEKIKRHFNIQIFGTDIDQDAIDIARAGIYPASIKGDVSPERMKRYFTKLEDGSFQIKKSIRETLVFAPQNIIKDPPFTKLDLISCRNLLIYLGPELQKRILPVFHYALKPNGFLFLGSSETVGQFSDLFAVRDKKWKIFDRKPLSIGAHPVVGAPTLIEAQEPPEREMVDAIQRAENLSALQVVETILKESDTPPCAIIDDACNVLYIHGRTGKFLEPAEGKISVNIIEMARPGLKVDLAAAIQKVAILKQEVIQKNLRLQLNGGFLHMNLVVKPILGQALKRGLMMAIFEEIEPPLKSQKETKKHLVIRKSEKTAEQLEQELHHTKEDLQTTIEELETSNEELKSTNEELQSTNEEMQSTNEEMETSKEELQSLNEEASTVNAELQSRIDELAQTYDDMKNLLDSTEIATIFLDTDLCIRRFTPKATEIIPLTMSDTGRPIKHFASKLKDVDLSKYANDVLNNLAVKEIDAESTDESTYRMRVRPYRTVNNVIDGVVITFDDITERKRLEVETQNARLLAENIVNSVNQPLVILDNELKVVSTNKKFYKSFHLSPSEVVGEKIYVLGSRQWDIPKLRKLLEKILPEKRIFKGFEMKCNFDGSEQTILQLNAREIRQEGKKGKSRYILLEMENITELVQNKKQVAGKKSGRTLHRSKV